MMTSYANPFDDPGGDDSGESWDFGESIVSSSLPQFTDLYGDLTLPEIDTLYSQFVAEYGDQYTPEQLSNLKGALLGGMSVEEMTRLSEQAKADVAPGGIMSGNPFGTQTGGTTGQSLLSKLLGNKNLLSTGLGALGALASYKSAKDAQKQAAGAIAGKNAPVTATRTAYKGTKYSAAGGGIGSLDMAQGGRALPPRYLDGHSDGMADKIPANIDGRRPAALSDGEFVIPADVVSHLGNGNSSAGAKRLYEMMDRIRHARTGNSKQGKQINPDKFMPR
jgi:hypothetical protein